MTTNEMLALVKNDLEIVNTIQDPFLLHLISAAQGAIAEEGITLTASPLDDDLIRRYAAWLYRKRATDGPMPVGLRRALNNRKISEVTGNA